MSHMGIHTMYVWGNSVTMVNVTERVHPVSSLPLIGFDILYYWLPKEKNIRVNISKVNEVMYIYIYIYIYI